MFPWERAEAIALACDIMQRAGIDKPLPRIVVRAVKCGRWYPVDKPMDGEQYPTGRIVLPVWLFDDYHREMPGFMDWYVGHELAHHVKGAPGHGVDFQLILAKLCPLTWHWESTYKPRAYAQALAIQNGMSSSMSNGSASVSTMPHASVACQPAHFRT
jgi:hypothetical protein